MQLRRIGLRSIGSVMPSIATWQEGTEDRIDGPDRFETITTESQQETDRAWIQSIESLLKEALAKPVADGLTVAPSSGAIRVALEWVVFLRSKFPANPPVLIAREPNGGIIIERRFHSPGGPDVMSELTIYDDLTVEHTIYVNGRITDMVSIPSRPPQSRGVR